MTLPILLSVPHTGLLVPPEAEPYCRLSKAEIIADGDEGAAEIYALEGGVAQFEMTDIARAIVDLNRAEDDFTQDGVVKTHTCWDVPVYDPFPPDKVVQTLLARYYRPYHERLQSPQPDVRLCVDCHTMAAVGPPVAPDAGQQRPEVCLGNARGRSLPKEWTDRLHAAFKHAFADFTVMVNNPFSGGHITRTHGADNPWLQVELSRATFLSHAEKRERVLAALTEFCERTLT